jgi:aspartyl-tRNA(Asn)/glutamyl-tRNA(Gln) amidotransferase subunit A
MWPGVADDLTRYSRSVLEQTVDYPLPRYAEAVRRRDGLVQDAARLFAEVDVVMTPTTAVPAFPAGGPPPDEIDGQPARPLGASATPFTMLANLCWNPAVSVPAGRTSAGLPVGLQVMARRHHDEVPLRLARIWEQTRPWPRTAPEA